MSGEDNRTLSLDDEGGLPQAWIADRYRLDVLIGKGGGGAVWRARDRVNGKMVAVKLLAPETANQVVRAGREVTAMRLLQLPGVVRLLDSGTDHDRPFIVMELIDGTPFPGKGVEPTWAAIAPRVRALVEVLRLVHAQGIVHRDLKPGNVLVDAEGRPTLLDFGIARGGALGPTVTVAHAVLGTPQYLAPEQLRGDVVDGRTDLYALGAMLFEILTGTLPHAQFTAKLHQDAPPLITRAPGVPEHAANFVDRLLARSPDSRPRSSDEALALLDPDADVDAGSIPYLGNAHVIDAMLSAAARGASLDVWGSPGSGTSRLLREVASRLRANGRVVVELGPGERPLESVASLIGRPTDTLGKPLAVAEDRLRERLRDGVVVVADHYHRLDRWSRSLIERSLGDGSVLRAADTPGALRLELFSATLLKELFWGPDLVLHLCEDAARILFERTHGLPAAVTREVTTWVAAGLARWESGRLRIDRLALDRLDAGLFLGTPPGAAGAPTLDAPLDDLLAWVALAGRAATPGLLHEATGIPTWEIEAELSELEDRGAIRATPGGRIEALAVAGALGRWSDESRLRAHRALAAQLNPGAPGRIEHLAAAGDVPAVADEAMQLAAAYLPAGAVGRAIGVLTVALSAVRGDPRAPREKELVVELARAALADGSPAALRGARFEVAKSPSGLDLAHLLDAWDLAQARQGEAAEALARDLPRFPDPELDSYRLLIPIRSVTARNLDEAERRILALGKEPDPSGVLATRKLLALGHVRYRQNRTAEAAVLYQQVAEQERHVSRRASALVNAGNALVEAGELERALETYARARLIASEHRLAVLEAGAFVGERTALSLLGKITEPNPEGVAALQVLGDPASLGRLALIEAVLAWRARQRDLAADLALVAFRAWDREGTEGLADLASMVGALARDDRFAIKSLCDRYLAQPHHVLAWPIVGFAAMGGVSGDRAAVDHVFTVAARSGRLTSGVLSFAEACRAVGR